MVETCAEMLQSNQRFHQARERERENELMSDLHEPWFDPLSVQDDRFASYSFVQIDIGILDEIGVDGQEHVAQLAHFRGTKQIRLGLQRTRHFTRSLQHRIGVQDTRRRER